MQRYSAFPETILEETFMVTNYAQTEKRASDTEYMLNSIMESVESQHPFSKKNFVSMQKLVFLWIVGDTDDQLEKLLETEVRRIVDDERVVWMIRSNAEHINEEEIYQKFYEGIDCASRNYLSVDMDHLMVCPIFLPGCFKSIADGESFAKACLFVQQEMRKRHRYPEWSPFVLLHDEKVDMTRLQLQAVVRFMNQIIEDGRSNFRDCCCPSCVISDVNERGQEISNEQKAKIIVMLTVFRNTTCENEDPLNTILLPVSKGDEEYFFTARAISICEPVKSLMLNRLLAVHNHFLHGRFSQEKIFDNWKHTFFEGSLWKEQLDKVPHDEKYVVLTAPIYSNIPLSDGKQYETALRKFCDRYYFDALSNGEEKILQGFWKSFWEEFFLQIAGSIESLDELEENREAILDKVPPMQVRGAGAVYTSDLRKGCADWLIRELKNYQRNLVEKAMKPDGRYMQRFRMKKEDLKDALQKLETSIRNQTRRLRQTELLLNTGGGHVADPEEEAEHWLQDYINNEPRRVTEIYRGYQRLLCEMFQKDSDFMEGIGSRLLEIYNKIVAGSIETREAYMKTKLANLAGSDMEQLILKLGESWLYPARLIGNLDQSKAQRLYVMGNRGNYLCRRMLEQQNYQVAFKESALDDRLEIVRVSDRFTARQIFSDEQEREAHGLL